MRLSGRRATSAGVNSAIVVFNAILIALLWAAVFALIRIEREATLRSAINRNDNLAIALEQYAARTIEHADSVIRYLTREYVARGEVDLAKFVATYTIDSKTISGIVLADEHGNAITTAYLAPPTRWVKVADREHFSVHVTRDTGRLYVGKPITGRITGKSLIPLTRRINRPDGTFAGVAMALIEPPRFTDVLHDARLRPFDIISLVGRDGITRARLRGTTATWGEDISRSPLFAEQTARPVGHYSARGQLDGVPRLFSYRTLADYDVIATVGTAEADVMADFYRTRRRYLWAGGLTTAFIAGFAAILMLALAAQRRAAAAVTRSQTRLLATFTQAAVGIAHCDLEGRYLAVNDKLCQILGYSREELLSKRFSDVTHPDDLPATLAYRRSMLDARGGATPVEREKRYLRKDGGTVWCSVTASPVYDGGGRVEYMLVIVQDISDRKRAEQELEESETRFRTVFEHAGIGIAMVGIEDGRLLNSNAALATMLGYSLQELSRLTVADVSESEDYEKDVAAWTQMVDGGSARYRLEKRYRRKDGSLLWGVLTATVVRDVNGRPLFLIGMLEDVTERKRAENAVAEYSARLREFSRRLMTLEEDERRRLGRELHDRAGANLSALLLSLGMLRQDLPPEALENVGQRLDDAETLLRETVVLVRDVLADLRPPGIDEFGLRAALMHHAQRVATRSGLEVRVEGPDPLPRPTAAVEIALFRIAQEAINNAVKHAAATRITVTLRDDAAALVLSVADNGAGFDADASNAGSGSLGMHTMIERAEAIGGRTSVRSSPGEGTEVVVEIPREG